MINIIDLRLGIDQLNKIFDNGNDIVFGQNLLVHFNIKTKFFVHSITTNFTEIVSLIREEQLVDNLGATEIELSADEMKQLDRVRRLKPEYPGYLAALSRGSNLYGKKADDK